MKFLLLCFLVVFSIYGFGQDNKTVEFTGIITDSITNKALAGATITFTYDNPKITSDNPGLYVKKNSISTNSGKFDINLPVVNKFSLTVSAIGYETLFKEIFLTDSSTSDKKTILKNFGAVKLKQNSNTLSNVVVTATVAPAMQFGIDRKIFNVEKNITSQGGTAVDVMKNIPSLSVDVDGNVQMRNSTPQILIDGRPTILTLDQIPADDIERVELITNPSAKFDASSAGGIINIVMKKNKRVGFNGIASVGAGSPSVLTGNINLNLREKKFNFFASGNYNKSGGN